MTVVRFNDDFGAFGPDQIKTMGQAFEGAWARIEGGLSGRSAEFEAARSKLAQTILDIAQRRVCTAKDLQDEAVERMFLTRKHPAKTAGMRVQAA